MQRARTNLYATSCKRASRMYRSCSIHLSRTCTVHKMHGCHLQHGGTVSNLEIGVNPILGDFWHVRWLGG